MLQKLFPYFQLHEDLYKKKVVFKFSTLSIKMSHSNDYRAIYDNNLYIFYLYKISLFDHLIVCLFSLLKLTIPYTQADHLKLYLQTGRHFLIS